MLLNKTPKTFDNSYSDGSLEFTLKKSMLLIYSETYPVNNDIDAGKLHLLNYHEQPLVMLTSFLNLPNQKRNSPKLSVLDVLKNMIDWDPVDDKNKKISTLDIVLAAPMFIYYVLRMLIKFPFSIAKLVTEFLPGIGEESCRIAMKNSEENSLRYHAFRIGYGIFSTLHFIGRAITSPIKGWIYSSENGKNKAMGILSLVTSSLAWGLIGAVTFVAPVIGLIAAPVLIAKLINESIFFGSLAFCSITFKALFDVFTRNDIVKPLLKNIIHAISPDKKDSNDSTDTQKFSDSPTMEMRRVIGINSDPADVAKKDSNVLDPTTQLSTEQPFPVPSDIQTFGERKPSTPPPTPSTSRSAFK